LVAAHDRLLERHLNTSVPSVASLAISSVES